MLNKFKLFFCRCLEPLGISESKTDHEQFGQCRKNADIFQKIIPEAAIELLKNGNKRFVSGKPVKRDHLRHIRATTATEHPFATVLGCMDSRVDSLLIFDQGIGDLFVVRIAGNIVNKYVLGSMEYACAVAGAKVIVVLGHTSCGAVKEAVDNVNPGNLSAAPAPLKQAIRKVDIADTGKRTSENHGFVDAVALKNVELSIEEIKKRSDVLMEMFTKKTINITGAMYDHTIGKVRFL